MDTHSRVTDGDLYNSEFTAAGQDRTEKDGQSRPPRVSVCVGSYLLPPWDARGYRHRGTSDAAQWQPPVLLYIDQQLSVRLLVQRHGTLDLPI